MARTADKLNRNSNGLNARLVDTSLHLTLLYFARVAKIIHLLRDACMYFSLRQGAVVG